MRDKLSIAAFAISALAFLVVLISPAPQAPAESAGTRSEGIVNRGQAESNALDDDARDLKRLKSRSAALGALHEKARPDDAATTKLVAGLIERETKRRWASFEKQLKTIRLYEKQPAQAPKPAKAAPAKAAAAKPDVQGAAAKKAAAMKMAAQTKARKAAAEKRAAVLKAREVARKKADQKKAAQDKKKGDQEKVEGGEW